MSIWRNSRKAPSNSFSWWTYPNRSIPVWPLGSRVQPIPTHKDSTFRFCIRTGNCTLADWLYVSMRVIACRREICVHLGIFPFMRFSPLPLISPSESDVERVGHFLPPLCGTLLMVPDFPSPWSKGKRSTRAVGRRERGGKLKDVCTYVQRCPPRRSLNLANVQIPLKSPKILASAWALRSWPWLPGWHTDGGMDNQNNLQMHWVD